jgi:hypothetical protein
MCCTKKMLMIGKCNEVFRISKGRISALLSAKTREEFSLAKKTFNNIGPDLKLLEHNCLTSQLNLNWSLIPRSIFLMPDDLQNAQFF